jgi:molybdenum cofactor synthesis domain
MTYTAAVITISDKGAAGVREDTSGPAICAELETLGWSVVYTSMVPDEPEQIKAELIRCADELGVNLALTSGGTGFSKRDITPEATLEVIERHTPGIPEAMRAESMRITSRGMLARQEAGIRGNTIIVNLPGSKKAALECFGAVASALKHGVEMLLGSAAIEGGVKKADGAFEPDHV